MCGEKFSLEHLSAGKQGSPPRVRGKGFRRGTLYPCSRITPACAGKRNSHFLEVAGWQDHPRVCGEKGGQGRFCTHHRGSPPRVRGKARARATQATRARITPACAGKRLKKAHKIKDFDPVPIRFHLVFRRFERWCSNLPTPDGNVPV